MIIAVEGPDTPERVTIVGDLVKRFRAHLITIKDSNPDGRFTYVTRALLRAIKLIRETSRPVVIDRLWLSWAVQDEVDEYRRWPLLGRLVDRIMGRIGGVYVVHLGGLVTDHFTRVFYGDRSLRTIRKDSYIEYLIYREPLEGREDVVAHYPGLSLDLFVEHVRGRLEALKPAYPLINHIQLLNGVGFPKSSSVLLVGDTPNFKGKGKAEVWPFHEYGNSSLYLMQVLNDIGARESDIFIVNINYTYGVEMVEVWLEYKRDQGIEPRVVCLGDNAEGAFVASFHKNVGSPYKGTPYIKVYHPSAGMRFPKYNRKFRRDLRKIFRRKFR